MTLPAAGIRLRMEIDVLSVVGNEEAEENDVGESLAWALVEADLAERIADHAAEFEEDEMF